MTCPLKRWMCNVLPPSHAFVLREALRYVDDLGAKRNRWGCCSSNSMNPFESWMNGGMDNLPEWCVDAME
ncbi:hypothetical protein N7527_011738 [Penicillium freii]|nr:hypothetical protein N7527_011738 [Penicillium freii]